MSASAEASTFSAGRPGAALAGVAALALAAGLALGQLPEGPREVLLLLPFAAAAVIDLRTRRIPNLLTLPLLVLALAAGAASGSALDALGGAAVAFAMGVALALAARGAFGMGDVKLMAGAGAAVGASGVLAFLLAMSLAGGLLAVALVLVHRSRGASMAYGPAVAAGCAVALLLA